MLRGIYLTGALAILTVPIADIWMDFDYRLAANISLTYIAILVTAFTVLYGLRSRWDSNLIGKAFFTKCCFLSLVLWQASASSWLGSDYPHRDHIRFVIYSFGAVAYLPMLVSLWREQQRDRRLWRQRDAMLNALTPDVESDSDPFDPLDPTTRPPL
jgi:hypothetical protein